MLTPDLRPLMGLPSPTSPSVSLFPTHEKFEDPQVSEVDLVDSQQLLTPDGVIHSAQKLGGLEQTASTAPLVKSSVEALPTPESVFKNRQVLTETLGEEIGALEQASTVSDADLAAQDSMVSPLIPATAESQVATPLESEPTVFTFDEESQLPSTLEESQAFDHTDEWVICPLRGSALKLTTSTGNPKVITFADPLSSLVNLI